MRDQRVGNYVVVRHLGSGAMGGVYEARHCEIGNRVAVKLLLPHYTGDRDVLRRFFNEARMLGMLNHRGIVKVFDYGHTPDGTAYMLMELLKGETLFARQERMVGRLSLKDALDLGRQIAAALGAAHAHGILHRDVKPGNIFLVPDPENPGYEQVKLLDFGLAKLLDHAKFTDQDPTMSTLAGTVLGTPFYMSPEQCLSKEVTEKSDVYGLGVVLYRMLTGRVPFNSTNDTEVLVGHIKHEPPPIRQFVADLPASLEGLVRAMLFKDPKLRPTIAQVIDSLRNLTAVDEADVTLNESVGFLGQLPPIAVQPPDMSGAVETIRIGSGALAAQGLAPPPAPAPGEPLSWASMAPSYDPPASSRRPLSGERPASGERPVPSAPVASLQPPSQVAYAPRWLGTALLALLALSMLGMGTCAGRTARLQLPADCNVTGAPASASS